MSPGRRQAASAGVIVPRSAAPVTEALPARTRWTTIARGIGAAGMLLLTGLLFWMLSDASFRVDAADVTIRGLAWADEASVRDRLSGLERSPNAFRVRASEIVGRLRELPAVSSARATVTLPASVTIEVVEREPLFAWSDGLTSALVDREGMLFAAVPDGRAPEGLPVVNDARELPEPWTVGDRLPADDVALMRQLLALTPASLGSAAADLELHVNDTDGYVLSSGRWQAVFGHYSPRLHPPELLPSQVQCLRWLLATYERTLERTVLATTGDRCGTFQLLERRRD